MYNINTVDFWGVPFKNVKLKQVNGGAVVDLQLPMQSMPIAIIVVSSNLDQSRVYNIMW
jgi:hypothetical protein